jgi:DNA repair protein RadD
MMQLRPYQTTWVNDIYAQWQAGHRNVLAALPTGGGKAVGLCHIISQHRGASCVIAHRQELVGQLCLTLGKFGVRHRVIGPKNLVQMIVEVQMDELGTSFYDPNAATGVAGVDTLVRRKKQLNGWLDQVTLGVHDEAHHNLRENKWGTAHGMFPNAWWLGVTATPTRADGKGLGAHADGFYDCLIEGMNMGELIAIGALSKYRIFAPPSDLDLGGVKISDATGDYNKDQLNKEVKRSTLVGDVVQQYLRIAPGKLGVTFANSVETATILANRYNAAGVPAEVVSAKTPDRTRHEFIRRLRSRQLLQLVNVDLFGEGFDLPAIEVVSMARPTQSYAVFAQQFGRALRPMPDKPHAIIIDHVGNTMRHGLPDAPRHWTLDRRERGAKSKRDPDVMPVTTCTECFSSYEAVYKACPWCGYVPVPAGRSDPIFVDGDLFELDAATLAKMRGEIERVDAPDANILKWAREQGHSEKVAYAIAKNQRLRQEAQVPLREAIAWWAGWQRYLKRSDSESYRRFFHTFGVDVSTAQTLGRKDAGVLADRIWRTMT